MTGTITPIDLKASKGDGELFLAGNSLHTPAFAILDLTPLWMGPSIRGEDLLIPGQTGLYPLPRRATATDFSLPMLIDGRYNRFGTMYDSIGQNEREGLRRNILFLRQLTDPLYAGSGMRYLTLTTPGDPEYTLGAYAHINGITVGREYGPIWRASLELNIPSGSMVGVTP